jgi:hypothetical protein
MSEFENRIRSLAERMDYPRTPDIAGVVTARLRRSSRFTFRKLAWSLTILLVLITSLMLIPSARAAILEFIQVGVVRIFRTQPTPLPHPNPQAPSIQVPVTATPIPTAQPLIPILRKLAGQMTLEQAQKQVKYPILLPSYPPDLGKPDYVFVQEADGAMTILVWLDPQKPGQVLMSLHFLPAGSWAIKKAEPNVIEETHVHGHYAVWTTGPYVLRLTNGNMEITRLIEGHVLIWENGNVTYRLETALDLKEAVKVAESFKPLSYP